MNLTSTGFNEVRIRNSIVLINVEVSENMRQLRLIETETPTFEENFQLLFIDLLLVELVNVFECSSHCLPLFTNFS